MILARLLLLALLIPAATTAVASDPDGDTIALAQRLDAELALAIDAAAPDSREIDIARLQRLEAEVDAGVADWSRQRGDAASIGKLMQMRGLLANARRYNELRASGAAASLPHAQPQPALAVRATTSANFGSSCRMPWELGTGMALATELAAAGASGDSFWVRVPASERASIALSTLGSRGDIDIAVYARCGDTPLLANDDYFGLQALAVLPSTSAAHLVLVGNRDRIRPAQARIEAVLATGFSGSVTLDPAGGASVSGIVVSSFANPTGYYVGSTTTDVNGNYQMAVSSAGVYYARTSTDPYTLSPLLHQAWAGVPCLNATEYYSLGSCGPAQPAPITVLAGQSTGAVDFALVLGRVLAFRVTNEADGAPIPGVNVDLASSSGYVGSRYTDSLGRVSYVGLQPGIEYRALFFQSGFRSEIFDNIPCGASCDLGFGTPIVFQPTDPHFRELPVALTPTRKVVVRVRDLQTSSYGATVQFLHASGQVAFQGYAYGSSTTPGWRNVTFAEPAPGTYYLQAGYTEASFWRLYPAVDCLTDCVSLLSQAQPVVITDAPGVVEYSIEPRPFPAVTGTVTDQQTGLPASGAIAQLVPLGSGGNQGSQYIAADGQYRFPYARPGSYLVAVTSAEHVDVAFPDAPCTGSGYSLVCPTATPVTITPAQNAFTFDFELTRSGSIGGDLTVEGAPLPTYASLQMRLRNANGSSSNGVLQRTTGGYTLGDVAPGQYRVTVEDSFVAYGQAYPGVDCVGAACLGAPLGQLLSVGSQALPDIDFDLRLQRGGKGRVLDATTGQPLAGVVVDIWAVGSFQSYYMSSGITGADGRFALPALDTTVDSYRLATSVGGAYINEVYNNVACPLGPAYYSLCDIALGTAVPALHPLGSQGISFRLTSSGSDVLFADGLED